MADDFRYGLDELIETHRDTLRDVVEGAESDFFQADWSDVDSSAEYEGLGAPHDLLRGRCDSLDDVSRAIVRVSVQWRLDVINALGDYID